MKLSEKIAALRKKHNLSQEELAEKLYVSRQAVSRWESGSAMPDAANLLQLSKLFHVTTDYLLYDDYEWEEDSPKTRPMPVQIQEAHRKQLRKYSVSGTLFAIAAFCYVIAVVINPDCHPLNYINILLSTFVAAVQFHQRRKLLDKIQNQDEG